MKKILSVILVLALMLSLTSCTFISEPTSGNDIRKQGETPETGNDDQNEKQDKAPEEKLDPVSELLAGMTLEQKITQMLMPEIRYWSEEEDSYISVTELNESLRKVLSRYDFGGVCLFADNTSGTARTASLISDIQNTARSSERGIPMLISVDQEGGYITRLGTGTSLCGNMALGATNDKTLACKAASVIASELYAEGFNINFAPDMDVNNEPNNPVIGVRSFSDDPNMAAEFGCEFIKGLHSGNIAAALKHFPGHGDTATDSHTGLPRVEKTLEEIRQCELIPFAAGIDSGADIIMTAHIQYPLIETETYVSKSTGEKISLPATLSGTIITDILRTELGFDGVVTTDAMNMTAIAEHFEEMDAARLAINAGVDILLMPFLLRTDDEIAQCANYIHGIEDMVNDGTIRMETIDAAVSRILRLKIELGIFERDFDKDMMVQDALAVVGSEENHNTEREITQKAITLVKNDDMLPLYVSENENIVFFCSYENEVTAAKYAVSHLKDEGIIPQEVSCEIYCYQDKEIVDFEEIINEADAVIAGVETFRAANMDAEDSAGWQAKFIDELIGAVHENGKKIAVISLQLPYDLARYQNADAILAAYCAKGMNTVPTEYNGETPTYGPNLPAAVSAVFGAFVPSGKLPVDIPEIEGQNIYTDEILYPRGYGLTW